MRFLLDHCVPNEVGRLLVEAGHDPVRLRDCMPVDSADATVLSKAGELDAPLVSLNGDFADIAAYPPASHGGVVSLQLHNRPELIPVLMRRLLDYLKHHPTRDELRGKLLIVEPHRIRVRI